MRVEYYIDADPGYGNGTALSIVAGKDLTGLAINIDLATVSSGVHIVGVRSLDANGAWSLDNRWLFIKPYPNNGAITLPKVDRVEYFIDNDPGYGNATALSIVPNTNFNNLSFDINLNTVASGVHVVGVRSRDENGAWSLDNRWLFVKPYPAGKSLNQPKIGRIEYYIDADPGYGNGIPLSFNSTNNISASFSINLAPLSQGVHIVGVRSIDSLGAWGLDNRWVFLKPYSAGVALPQPNITQVEYWVDGDPGYGHATQVSVVAAKDIANLSFPVDISNLSVGVQHKIGVRSRDANGAWSLDNLWAITIVSHAGLLNSIGDATSLKQEALTNSLRLQYNPVHQQAVVLYTSTKEDKTTIRVIDNLGRVVQTKEAKLFAGVNIITLETGVLANGVYTVQAAGPKQNLSVRMMKQ